MENLSWKKLLAWSQISVVLAQLHTYFPGQYISFMENLSWKKLLAWSQISVVLAQLLDKREKKCIHKLLNCTEEEDSISKVVYS